MANLFFLGSSLPGGGTANKEQVPVPIEFLFDSPFLSNQSDVEIFDAKGLFQRIAQPKSGSIVGILVQLTGNVTAGQLKLQPTINGTKCAGTSTALDITLTSGNKATANVAFATNGFNFNSLDEIGVMATSNLAFSGNVKISVTLFTAYN